MLYLPLDSYLMLYIRAIQTDSSTLNNTRRLCFGDHIKDTISFSSSFTLDEVLSASVKNDVYLFTIVLTIDVKAIAKPWNVFTGGSSFFKGTFLTKAMKIIQWHGFNL